MSDPNRKSVFFDKRDANYIQLTSPIFFYEMFTKKKIKCDLIIPHTIIFTKGSPTLWLFNSRIQDTPAILKKNSNKLNPVEVCRVLCKVKQSDEYRIDTLTTLFELIKHTKNETVAFARVMRQSKRLAKQELLRMFLESNLGGLTTLQEHIQNHSKADEIYFVEYRQDVQNLPVSYRYFKKSTTQKQSQPMVKKPSHHLMKQFTTSSHDEDELNQITYEPYDCMFKFFDNAMNGKFQNLTKRLVDFIERAYKIKVKKLVAKFMLDPLQQIYFLGLKELLIDIVNNGKFDCAKVKEELRDNCSFENFLIMLKMFTKKLNRKPFQIPQTIYEDDKEISQCLFKHLIVHKCVGDFCEYIMDEKNRGPLQIRKNIVNDRKKYFGDKKINEEKFTVTLPHEISFQLILRTRECASEVIELLKKNKIFNRTSKHHLQEYDTFNDEKEYPFQFNKTEVFNLPNLYRTVKICKNCFVVYSLTMKYFDQRLVSDLQSKKWALAQQKSQQQFHQKPSTHVPSVPKPPEQSMQKDASLIYVQNQQDQSQVDILKTQHSARDASMQEGEKKERVIKSASQFRITKNVEPKTFKIYMPKPTTAQSGKSTSVSQKNLNNFEVNRLTMGFLNYGKPPRPQSQQNKVRQHTNVQNRHEDSQHQQQRMIKSAKLSGNTRQQLFSQKLRIIDHIQKEFTLEGVCEQQGLEFPPESIPDIQLEAVNYFSYQQCAFPYLIVQCEEEISGLDLSGLKPSQQIVVFLGDFYDNIFEYYESCMLEMRDNTKVILFNLPGQAYTVFNKASIMDNLDVALMIDAFLFELQSKDFFNAVNRFKFFGIGYGAFQILNYLAHAGNNLPNLDKVVLVNPFCEIDSELRDTLEKSRDVFSQCPPDMPETSFHYWNSLKQSKEERNYDPRLNPISIDGRIYIINGLLRSQNLWIGCESDTEMQIYHGLRNCLVNITQSQKIKSQKPAIKLEFLDSGHKVENVMRIFADFLA